MPLSLYFLKSCKQSVSDCAYTVKPVGTVAADNTLILTELALVCCPEYTQYCVVATRLAILFVRVQNDMYSKYESSRAIISNRQWSRALDDYLYNTTTPHPPPLQLSTILRVYVLVWYWSILPIYFRVTPLSFDHFCDCQPSKRVWK